MINSVLEKVAHNSKKKYLERMQFDLLKVSILNKQYLSID